MSLKEARDWIALKTASDPLHDTYLTAYYKRFSFSLTPFIVVFFSCALGGRFKKNILLLSLLVSLGIAILYYGSLFALTIMGNKGAIPPAFAAWIPIIVLSAVTAALYRWART